MGYSGSLYDEHIKCVQRLLTKHQESWDYVVHNYVPFVRSMVAQAGLNPDEADESVQATLASLWEEDARALREYEGKASFRTYLARIAHRDCLDFLRKKNRLRRKVQRKSNAYIVSGTTEHPEEKVEEKLDVEKLLETLDDKAKVLVKLFYYDSLTSEEVAVIFGVKPSTVDVWHYRLREKLRGLAATGDSQHHGNTGGTGR